MIRPLIQLLVCVCIGSASRSDAEPPDTTPTDIVTALRPRPTGPASIDMFFSGGGIRATYGTLIAMCEIIKYQQEHKDKFIVENIVGLSGGAWGVSLLGATDATACRLVERVKSLDNWGEVDKFKPARCSSWDGPLAFSCFHGWVKDIERWFKELLPHDRRQVTEEGENRDMYAPVGFGRSGFGLGKDIVRVWVQTDPCHFGKPPARWAYGDGACVVAATDENMYCMGNEGSKKFPDEVETVVSKCQSGDGGTVRTSWKPLEYMKILAYSSAAWASATAASNGALAGVFFTSIIAGGDKTTPYVRCKAEDSDEQVFQSQFCDAGGECNLPLGSLEVMYRHPPVFFGTPESVTVKFKQFIAFDYSDNQGDALKAKQQCLKKWEKVKGWRVLHQEDQPWGYSMVIKANGVVKSRFILHIVLFRGAETGDNLVKEFPTMQTISPNFFTPTKARRVHTEYKGFLLRDLFGQSPNPFTLTADEWKQKLLPDDEQVESDKGEVLDLSLLPPQEVVEEQFREKNLNVLQPH